MRPRLRDCRSRPRGWPSLPGLPRSRPNRIALRWPETRGAPPIPGIRIFHAYIHTYIRTDIHTTDFSLGVHGDEEAEGGRGGAGAGLVRGGRSYVIHGRHRMTQTPLHPCIQCRE